MSPIGVPSSVPLITIEPSAATIERVDCPELQWWQIVPRVGDQTVKAFYECDTGLLDFTERVASVAPGHDDGTVVVTVQESDHQFGPPVAPGASPHDGLGATFRFTCLLDHERARWLEVEVENADGTVTSTEATDPGFHLAWGDTGPRRIEAGRRYQRRSNGTIETTDDPATGEGTYTVTVGDRQFLCLRVLDYRDPNEEFGESFIDQSGRTVLYRQYRPISWDPDWQSWQRDHPDGIEMTIDGQLFMHRDCTGLTHVVLTSMALGL
jgi:hypothetical protein